MIKFGNDIIKVNGGWINYTQPVPPYTIRLRYTQGTTPTFSKGTGVLIDATNNIWDLTNNSSDWRVLLPRHTDLLEVIEANTEGVTTMYAMFLGCTSLTSIPLFDTSMVTNMFNMFSGCSLLRSIPLFDTSSVTNMMNMFKDCTNVQSGALALYQQASTQVTPPTNHTGTFMNCGRDTTTGAAELAQIPSDWK